MGEVGLIHGHLHSFAPVGKMDFRIILKQFQGGVVSSKAFSFTNFEKSFQTYSPPSPHPWSYL